MALAEAATFVTTLDNPYDYFTQFDEWYAFDTQHGYNTCGYVDRIAKTSNELSEHDRMIAINDAVDEILAMNVLGIYVKVTQKPKNKQENKQKNDENE